MAVQEVLEIVAINSDDDESVLDLDKPIIQLFKRLINNDNNKQSTILTNAQIVDILDKEFGINLWDIHELEGEIYLTIMKKFLKDWPQWDEFDKTVNILKTKNDKEGLNRMLESNYHDLIDHLKVMLGRAQAIAKSTVNKMIEDKMIDANVKNKPDSKDDNVVLEIQCSRQQLNQVIFRRPHPNFNDSIFNGADSAQTQIKVTRLPLDAILNWWDVKISIVRGNTYLYERRTTHELSHVLVNKNLMSRYNPLKVLPQEIELNQFAKSEQLNTSTFKYVAFVENLKGVHPTLVPLLKFIQRDIRLLPDKIASRASYKRYTNKYPYIRYLYKEVKKPDINSRKYDLQLEETISPQYRIFLGPLSLSNPMIEVECTACSVKFVGLSLIPELKAHFEERHADEKDWKCTNCNKMFSMATLAQNWWTHKC
ncbi:uncharacterized protein LOC123878796 [Maniola jurtina]|uniref:uncharacterized protein LOC123878796 n=1 Tax=Maniola jurtina TaxID=191418 RepID=UPI001E689654|nr:uncharacterized protein LOC123878796 [Maniola jurtina]XP_045782078.1 uncharacterized protein LOC123878796 [Maniola jurtina]